MICINCAYYRAQGKDQPIAPMCAWTPSPEIWEFLKLHLPAPTLSRITIKHAPYQVESCATFQEKGT